MPKTQQAAPQLAQSQQENGGSDDRDGISDSDDGFIPVKNKKKAKKGKTYQCKGGDGKLCGRTLGKNEDAIQCEGCCNWFHPNCQGLSAEAFKAIGRHDLFWVCQACRKGFKETVNLGKVLARVEQAEKNIVDSINKESRKSVSEKGLEEKINMIETKVVEKLSEQKKEIIQSSDRIQKIVQEKKEEREMNLIIHNIPESDSAEPDVRKDFDLAQFQAMSQALVGEDTRVEVEKIFRLGKKDSSAKPRLMLVKLKKQSDANNLYRKRFKLTEVGFKNRYITRDLSPEERIRQKELREELKSKGRDTHRIFRNRVIPRESRQQ